MKNQWMNDYLVTYNEIDNAKCDKRNYKLYLYVLNNNLILFNFLFNSLVTFFSIFN
jgi:hypothetical protein